MPTLEEEQKISHFTVGVIVMPEEIWPGQESLQERTEAAVERLLSPYDENLRCPPHEEACHCIGKVARQAARARVETQRGPFSALREQLAELPQEEREQRWEEEREVREALTERWARLHPARGEPDLTCGCYTEAGCPAGCPVGQRFEDGSGCGGTGRIQSTDNPRGWWDYWVIGGRWSGALYGADLNSTNDLRRNSQEVRTWLQLAKPFVPFALVLPSGAWLSKARMGWFGCASGEMPQEWWEAEVRKQLEAWEDGTLILVDAHI